MRRLFFRFFFFFFFFVLCFIYSHAETNRNPRRVLQDPFFVTFSPPPPPAPINPQPFFPSSNTPSPPSTPSLSITPAIPTFPANITSLNASRSKPPISRPSSFKIAAAVLLPLFFLSLLCLCLVFFINRSYHHRHSDDPQLFGDEKPFSTQSCENLDSPQLGSPELRPLPPLCRYAGGGVSSSDEFYSPRNSSAEKESFKGAQVLEKSRSRSSVSSTVSYPSSRHACSPDQSSSPAKSSPTGSAARLVKSGSFAGDLLPLTLSQPEKKPGRRSWKIEEFQMKLFETRQPEKEADPPSPPPPPPLPPSGYRKKVQNQKPLSLNSTFIENSPLLENDNSCEAEQGEENTRPKLKPLHWDKVRTSSDREMVWDQMKSSSFKLNEEMIETLFVCNNLSSVTKETGRQPEKPSLSHKRHLLDPRKSQNIAILLRALNISKEEVCQALLEGRSEGLGTELLETLLKMAPTREEEKKLLECKDDSSAMLGPAEKFVKALLEVPFAFKRIDTMLYIANFDYEVDYLKKSFETLEIACEELRSSRLFLRLLEAVLKAGNRMNIGTDRGDAHAFKLDTLLKLVDVKGADGKTTLLHFVVQETIKAEGARMAAKTGTGSPQDEVGHKKLGLKAIAGLGGELINVKKAAAMDSEVLSSYVTKLAAGIGKVEDVLRLNGNLDGSGESQRRFHSSLTNFLKKAEDDIIKVQAQESVALSLVKEITEYFHGNSAREEAHPFRIFMVVKDFISILDQVCKEVGRVNERAVVGVAWGPRQLTVPVNPTLPPVFPRLHSLRPESSSEEEGSSSSPS